MTIDALILLSGAFVAALPFLGFPNSWDTFFFLAAGIFIIGLGIVVRRRLARKVTVASSPNEESYVGGIPRHEEELVQ